MLEISFCFLLGLLTGSVLTIFVILLKWQDIIEKEKEKENVKSTNKKDVTR